MYCLKNAYPPDAFVSVIPVEPTATDVNAVELVFAHRSTVYPFAV